jgi:hypothetical protein
VRKSLIGFTVSYGESDNICSWVGRLGTDRDGKECISTLWQFVSAETYREEKGVVSRAPAALWEAFHVQADIFYRQTP